MTKRDFIKREVRAFVLYTQSEAILIRPFLKKKNYFLNFLVLLGLLLSLRIIKEGLFCCFVCFLFLFDFLKKDTEHNRFSFIEVPL